MARNRFRRPRLARMKPMTAPDLNAAAQSTARPRGSQDGAMEPGISK